MRRVAWAYVIGILLSALALSLCTFVARPAGLPPVWVFLALTAATTFMRLFHIVAPDHRSYEGSTIAFTAGFLLLPPWLFVLQIVVSQSIEWAWVRIREPGSLRAWYLQPFNMAKCILGGIFASVAGTLLYQAPMASIVLPRFAIVLPMVVIYVAVNQLILGLALKLARGISFREAGILRDSLLLELPLACTGYVTFELFNRNPIEVVFALAPIVLIYQVFTLPKVQDEAMKALEKVNQELTDANASINRLNGELFQALAKVFDMRDPYVGGHAAQVATYAVAIATEMGLPPERIELVRQSAYLHDIGKLSIPEAILHKPGTLTEIEYEFIKKHSDIGGDLLLSTEGLKHLAPFVRHHHERWDGLGYPAGLAGESIPLEARILNVCDSVESMASDRPYHRAMSVMQIMAEIHRCSGSQFDPKVVDVFISVVAERGPFFVINSARSVAQQYAASLLAGANSTYNILGWVPEGSTTKQSIACEKTEPAAMRPEHRAAPEPHSVATSHNVEADYWPAYRPDVTVPPSV